LIRVCQIEMRLAFSFNVVWRLAARLVLAGVWGVRLSASLKAIKPWNRTVTDFPRS
jgi:hypothetical protein